MCSLFWSIIIILLKKYNFLSKQYQSNIGNITFDANWHRPSEFKIMPLFCTCLAARFVNLYKYINICEYSHTLSTFYLVLGFECSQICLLFWRFWNRIAQFLPWYSPPKLTYNSIHLYISPRNSCNFCRFSGPFLFQGFATRLL